MKNSRFISSISGAILLSLATNGWAVAAPSGRQVVSFDDNWLFLNEGADGAEVTGFNDGAWRHLTVPHDWAIEGPFDRNNPVGGSGAFLPMGIGWYRKHFALHKADHGKRVFVDLDGVMGISDVWVNGFHLGQRPNGATPLHYELTEHVNFDGVASNVIAVKADNSQQPAARWYTGAGIYRHVHLSLLDPVHLENNSVFVTTPHLDSGRAVVHVEGVILNESGKVRNIVVAVNTLDMSAKSPGQSLKIEPGRKIAFSAELDLETPFFWSLDNPHLYELKVSLHEGCAEVDAQSVAFGIRDARFDAATGFWLNGKNVRIKGVCLHENGGAFGSAIPLNLWKQRLTALRSLGVNAIRTEHNPPASEFLELCDRMGFLVMDEMFDCWMVGKRPYDYHLYFGDWADRDLRDAVRRDRNHPSIILYSAGNEIHDTPNAEAAKQILARLISAFHAEDPTRPVTQALFRPNVSHDYDDGLADMLDVVGQNYRENELLAAHDQNRRRKIIGTETTQVLQAWLAFRDHPALSGQFLWVGVDYLGESPGWPFISEDSGLLDRIGVPKPRGWERQSWWSDTSMVKVVRCTGNSQPPSVDPGYQKVRQRQRQVLFHDWTPALAGPHEERLEVYSNCEKVELFLNSRSLGAQVRHPDDSPRIWKVAYEPGTVKAVATNSARVAAIDEIKTAGPAVKLELTAGTIALGQGFDDVATVTARLLDANGVLVPDFNNAVDFKAVHGEVVAVDNGDTASHEMFTGTTHSAYQGQVVAYVRAKDGQPVRLNATSISLSGATIELTVHPSNQ